MRVRASTVVALLVVACADPPCRVDYGDCAESSECASGAACEDLAWAYGAGRVCQRSCDSAADCPATTGTFARCLDVGSPGEFHCFLECGHNVGCPEGWVCQQVLVDHRPLTIYPVCLP